MKQLFQITPDSLPDTSQYDLYFVIAETHCYFGLVEHSSGQLQQLYYYISENDNDILQSVFEKHPELNHSFHNVKVCYHYPQALLTPVHLHQNENSGTMLETLFGPASGGAEETVIISENISEWQINNSYAVPQKVHNKLSRQFSDGKFCHEYSVLLKNMLTETGSGDSLIIDFIPNQITVFAVKNSRLQLAQKFFYDAPADVIYFLVKICEQFSFNRQLVKILLSGLIDQESAVYNEIHKYFINISFRKVPEGIKLAENFNAVPDHYFITLYNLVLCE